MKYPMRSHMSAGTRSMLVGACVVVTFGIHSGSRFASRVHGQSRDVEQTIERFLVPFSNRDVARFAEFFAEDATMFFPSAAGQPANRVEGQGAIGQEFKELYERAGPPRGAGGTIQPQDLKVQRFDGFAVVTFHLGTDAARGRRTFVLRRDGSAWKIVHVHASQANPAG